MEEQKKISTRAPEAEIVRTYVIPLDGACDRCNNRKYIGDGRICICIPFKASIRNNRYKLVQCQECKDYLQSIKE